MLTTVTVHGVRVARASGKTSERVLSAGLDTACSAYSNIIYSTAYSLVGIVGNIIAATCLIRPILFCYCILYFTLLHLGTQQSTVEL